MYGIYANIWGILAKQGVEPATQKRELNPPNPAQNMKTSTQAVLRTWAIPSSSGMFPLTRLLLGKGETLPRV